MQTFGELKTRLTEHDLECILNTKMITANRAEELVKQQVVGDMEEEEDYINASSLFNRVAPPAAHSTPAIEKEELIKRSKALSGVDKISSQPASTTVQYACFIPIKRLVNSNEEDTFCCTPWKLRQLYVSVGQACVRSPIHPGSRCGVWIDCRSDSPIQSVEILLCQQARADHRRIQRTGIGNGKADC